MTSTLQFEAMSRHLKINLASALAAILSALGSASYVIWKTGQAARDIDTQGEEIQKLRESDKHTSVILSKLDERSTLTLEAIKELRAMLKH